MLMSHMESKGQRWPDMRSGEIGDVSNTFNYVLSDMMMNNLWVYDYGLLQESQNDHASVFPDQVSTEFAVSDPVLSSSSFLLDDTQHNIENDDPNSVKISEKIEPKVAQKKIRGLRSKRGKRTVFEGQWNFPLTPFVNLHRSVDNQASALSKRTLVKNDVGGPTLKKQKGVNLETNDMISESIDRCDNGVGLNSVGRWLEDVGFGRYAGVFEMHEVDEEALPLLTLDDLKEMGVLAVGTRRKLYAAICQLKGD
ncbi:uncharacterized protein [Rutidosis leptorrhynchoides]|uniref:uncharacterized protein n=1 Tax=Rutidosis leptorrhynchoides TaxID=125765 RepID=UPI003A993C51